jgi:membrane protease YdiL (CAAX protease family)
MEGTTPDYNRRDYPLLMHTGMLFLTFLIGIFFSQIVLQLFSTALGAGDLDTMLGSVKAGESLSAHWVIALQAGNQIFGFACAALITQAMLRGQSSLLQFHSIPLQSWLTIPPILLCVFALIPFFTLSEAQFKLPENMQSIELQLKTIELESETMLQVLLGGADTKGIMLRVFVFSLLPGVCEELFFRGALQSIFTRRIGPHAAIWITGLIFSIIHFQVYGSVPRFLLGVIFGYLTFWSGSLWPAMAMHALFNGGSLLLFYHNENQMQDGFEGIPVYLTLIAASILISLLYYFRQTSLYQQNRENR